MARSLIRKNQLHPDIGDLVTGYGSSIFVKSGDFGALAQSLSGVVEFNKSITVLTTGDQNINGLKNFSNRITINNSGVVLQGEILPGTVYVTGDQTISGLKNFITRPTVNGSGVFLRGEHPINAYLLITGSGNLSAGLKYVIDTSANSYTVNLPLVPLTGDSISILDYNNTFDINSLIINKQNSKIEG